MACFCHRGRHHGGLVQTTVDFCPALGDRAVGAGSPRTGKQHPGFQWFEADGFTWRLLFHMQPFLSRVHPTSLGLECHIRLQLNRSSGSLSALQYELLIYEIFTLFQHSNSVFLKPRFSGNTRDKPDVTRHDVKHPRHPGFSNTSGSRIEACPDSIRGSGWRGHDFSGIYLELFAINGPCRNISVFLVHFKHLE